MSGNIYAVLGTTELEVITWLSGLDVRFGARYAEQALIGRKGLLQHTGFAPDEIKMRVLLHAQWCQPAEELARIKRIMDDTEPVAFVLGSGEYRGVFVVADLDVSSVQTDGSGVAIAFEAEISLREYIGDPAMPSPPGVIAQGFRIPMGAGFDAAGAAPIAGLGRLGDLTAAVSAAVAAVGQVATVATAARTLASVAADNPLAATAVFARHVDGLRHAAGALPVDALNGLRSVAAIGADAAQAATELGRARVALQESAQWLELNPLHHASAAARRTDEALSLCRSAAGALARLATRATVRGPGFAGDMA